MSESDEEDYGYEDYEEDEKDDYEKDYEEEEDYPAKLVMKKQFSDTERTAGRIVNEKLFRLEQRVNKILNENNININMQNILSKIPIKQQDKINSFGIILGYLAYNQKQNYKKNNQEIGKFIKKQIRESLFKNSEKKKIEAEDIIRYYKLISNIVKR